MALFGWPVVCVILFIALPLELAAIGSMLGGYLLLPSNMEVNLPLVPPIDKTSLTAVATALLCCMKGAGRPPAARQSWIIYLLGLCYVIAPLFTTINNSYELPLPKISIPGFYPIDAVKTCGRNLIFLAPFFIGSRFLSTDRARIRLLKALSISALIYSIPMLFELRFSPQLHRIVYGYHPSEFQQQVRDGGFRPVVFLSHGLEVALFVALALIATLVATRAKWRVMRIPAGAASAYLLGLLVLCKSLGSAIYGVVLAPIILFTRPKTWTRIAVVLLLIVCAYPEIRWHQLLPVHQIADAATKISADRSSSFEIRVKNEDQLLAKGEQKPVFGWGTWGRNRIFDPYGNDISITDGAWIIEFGQFGWFGYLSLFGLFLAAGVRAMRSVGEDRSSESFAIGGLSLLLAVNCVDLLPNSSLTPITFLVAGSLTRAVQVRSRRAVKSRPAKMGHPAPAVAS